MTDADTSLPNTQHRLHPQPADINYYNLRAAAASCRQTPALAALANTWQPLLSYSHSIGITINRFHSFLELLSIEIMILRTQECFHWCNVHTEHSNMMRISIVADWQPPIVLIQSGDCLINCILYANPNINHPNSLDTRFLPSHSPCFVVYWFITTSFN